jgi:hypothetical protein
MRLRLAGFVLAVCACGSVSGEGDVTLGAADGVPPIDIDRYFRNLPQLSETTPPDGPVTFQTDGTTTYAANIVTNADASRTLTFVNDVVVFDEAQSKQVSAKLVGLNVNAIKSVTVTTSTFALKNATVTAEPPVDLTSVLDLTVRANNTVLLTEVDFQTLQSGQNVTRTLSQADLAPLSNAVQNGTAATVNLGVSTTVAQKGLSTFPTAIHLIVHAQPSVDVAVLSAIK